MLNITLVAWSRHVDLEQVKSALSISSQLGSISRIGYYSELGQAEKMINKSQVVVIVHSPFEEGDLSTQAWNQSIFEFVKQRQQSTSANMQTCVILQDDDEVSSLPDELSLVLPELTALDDKMKHFIFMQSSRAEADMSDYLCRKCGFEAQSIRSVQHLDELLTAAAKMLVVPERPSSPKLANAADALLFKPGQDKLRVKSSEGNIIHPIFFQNVAAGLTTYAIADLDATMRSGQSSVGSGFGTFTHIVEFAWCAEVHKLIYFLSAHTEGSRPLVKSLLESPNLKDHWQAVVYLYDINDTQEITDQLLIKKGVKTVVIVTGLEALGGMSEDVRNKHKANIKGLCDQVKTQHIIYGKIGGRRGNAPDGWQQIMFQEGYKNIEGLDKLGDTLRDVLWELVPRSRFEVVDQDQLVSLSPG